VEPPRITPVPDEAEREAILAALAEEDSERRPGAAWAETLLPARGGEEDEP
jgi:hypothetical protein